MPGVSVVSGLITLTRILRSSSFPAQAGANDRSAAMIAAYAPVSSSPLASAPAEFKMTDPPSFSSGSALADALA